MIKSHEWFENKVHDYHEDKVTLLSRYNAPRQIQRQEAIERDRQKYTELKFIVNLVHGGESNA